MVQENYNQMIINQISFQMNQILISIKKYNDIIDSIGMIYPKKDLSKIDFSRVDLIKNIKCNFCIKIAYYQDINDKYYCWFHRSQYE